MKICLTFANNNLVHLRKNSYFLRVIRTWLIVCLFSYCKIYSQTKHLTFENFFVEQGMPTVVNYILQDRIGYLWFATSSGLYKFDGYNFTSYKHDIGDSNSLIDNTINTLYTAKGGNLWMGTQRGLDEFNPEINTFTHYKPGLSEGGNDLSNNISAICEDKYGKIWIGTGDGLFRFDKSSGIFECFRYDSTDVNSISHSSIYAIYKDKEERLWFGTQVGLDRFDFQTGNFIHCWIDEENRDKIWYECSNHLIYTIFEDEAGILWLGASKGLIEYNIKENTLTF